MPTLHFLPKEEQHMDGVTACGFYGWSWGTTNWSKVDCPYCLATQQSFAPDSLKAGDSSLPESVRVENTLPAESG